MKLLKPTYLLRTLLLLCAVAVVSSACERNETQSLSDKLDHMIANRQVYDCQKEQRIAELRHLLSVSGLTPAQEYEINDRLFGEFHKYKLDSAIRYMERNVLLARRLGDRRKGCLSGIRLAELYSSTGMSIEAKRMLDSIDRRSVPRDMLATYYKAYNRFYQQYVAFSGQRHFRELEERYQDSVIMFADTVSVRYKLDRFSQMSRRNQSHEMEVRLLGFLNSLEPDSQLYAECAYSVGSFYRRRGDDWLARKYYMLSAMTDIRNSTKENAAFQALATLYYRHDDLFRAFRYTQAAVEDALFSNVQFRTVQMSELYSIIIAELRHLLSVSGLTPAQEYEINDRLFGEFHKYKLDSAIRYMERNVLLARRLGDRRKGCLSGIRLAELYSSTGMSIEAKRMLDSIDRRSVPRDMLATYYKAYNRFYQQYVAFSGQRHFRELEERYQDSVIMFADTVSVRYKLDRFSQMSRRNQSHEMEVRLLGFLNSLEPDSQLYAECAYSVGSFYRRRGDDWLARKYYMLSAMTDIRNSTKENAAFQALATLYYRHDDLFRAFRYTQAAVEDALFSNVQFRTVQMSELYSIIIASHQAKESRTKHKLQYYLVLISVLSAVLVLLFVYLYKQLRRVYRIKEELSQTNAKLARLNEELGEKNEQLSDSNAVKVQYIARFFDLCSMYIDKMDDYRKSLKKLAQDRKFDELNRRLKSTSMLEDEQDELYKNFDAIFLNLYPSFVEDFNALLTEDERIVLKQEDLLNKELRIYALLRLGITDSVKIASFLRCSLSTVYNYRTKVRNKAAISREEFEKMVMKIGTAHKTDV